MRFQANVVPRPAEQRNGFDNLILLCPNHHRKVDYLIPEDYPVDVLQKMKADHENADWGATEADLSRFAQLLLTELVTDVSPPADAQAPGARQRTVKAMPTRTTSTSPPTSITPARRRQSPATRTSAPVIVKAIEQRKPPVISRGRSAASSSNSDS